MKKIYSIAFVAVTVLGFVSCKKDYTCNCKSSFMGIESTSSYTFKDTKSGATSKCSAMATTVTVDSMSMGTTCTLK
jgi:uncharacterized lipoprotein YehR (DUF1307 family)